RRRRGRASSRQDGGGVGPALRRPGAHGRCRHRRSAALGPAMPRLIVRRESFKLAQPFAISRGSKTVADTVVAELQDGALRGRGECVPYPRYGETVDGVAEALEAMADKVADGLDRAALQEAMPAGAARNALDAAFWDLEAKANGTTVWAMAGIA